MEKDIVGNNPKTTKLGGITGKGFMPGKSGNPSGRPKGTLKDYVRQKLIDMSPEEKEKFLKEVTKSEMWKMAEGSPDAKTDITSNGESLKTLLVEFVKSNGTKPNNNTDTTGVPEII